MLDILIKELEDNKFNPKIYNNNVQITLPGGNCNVIIQDKFYNCLIRSAIESDNRTVPTPKAVVNMLREHMNRYNRKMNYV